MQVTEPKARLLACPFARHFDAYDGPNEPFAPTCLGSQCMSWDWIEQEIERKTIQLLWDEIAAPTFLELDKLVAESEWAAGGWTPSTKSSPRPSTIYNPAYEEQLHAWREQPHGPFTTANLKSGKAVTFEIVRERPERLGQCGRTVYGGGE